MDYLVVLYLAANLVTSEWFSIAFRAQLLSLESQKWRVRVLAGSLRLPGWSASCSTLRAGAGRSSRRQALVAGFFVCSALFL